MIIQGFEKQVKRDAGRIAVKVGETSLTYGELNRYANAIGRLLREKEDCRSASVVGLLYEHGADMIAAILGALKAGKIYVPLSVDYPENRLRYMLTNSGAGLILTNRENLDLSSRLAEDLGIGCLVIDDAMNLPDPGNPDREIEADRLAYIMYTSGSTGRPKGVMQTHRNVLYFTRNWSEFASITELDRMTLLASFCHDASVMDLFSALHSGACLYPFSMGKRDSGAGLAGFLRQEQITVWHSVPSLFGFFAGTLSEGEMFPDLRCIFLGGEEIRGHEVRMFKKYFPAAVLVCVYGQTESSVDSFRLIRYNDHFDKPLLGKSLEGTQMFVVDKHGQETAPLQIGEILVASRYISPGYWQNPEANRKAFADDEEYGRLYFTGDLGRLLLDGDIEFLGRADNQVKIRGFRIELGEIESQLLRYPGIREAAVLAHDGENQGDKYLCAYFVAEGAIETTVLRDFLAKEVPDYMVPAFFMPLERMPLTQSNKIDRRAFPAPDRLGSKEYTAPRDELEEQLAKIWQESLGLARVGIHDHFIDLGGHSLSVLAVVSRVRQEFNVNLRFADIFDYPTVEALARRVMAAEKSSSWLVEPVEEREYYPVSSDQVRMFLLDRMDGIGTTYNMSSAVRIEGKLDRERLQKVFSMLVQRHEGFRSTFRMLDDAPVQSIRDRIDFPVVYHDLTGNGQVCGNKDLERETITNFYREFDLAEPPLLRVGLARLGPEEHLLLTDMHHIISDALSVGILIREFIDLYSGRILPPLTYQYKDYTAFQEKFSRSPVFLEQQNYWLKQLSGPLPTLDMPLDYERPARQTFEGQTLVFGVSREKSDRLNRLAKEERLTLNILVLSLYALLISRYSGQADVMIGSLTAGRKQEELKKVIGMFANFLPLRFSVKEEFSVKEYLAKTRDMIMSAYENQDYPFEKLVEALKIPPDPARNPLFDTLVNFVNRRDLDIDAWVDGLRFSGYPLEKTVATLDIKLDVGYDPVLGEMTCYLQYNTSLFKRETMEGLIRHFQALLDQVVADPEQKISAIGLFSESEGQELCRRRRKRVPDKPVNLAISASFTAEPVADYIRWWGSRFGLEIDIRFAAYNQVFQELLDPCSLFSQNQGINLVLLRFEDWLREGGGTDQEKCEKLERDFESLSDILTGRPAVRPMLVGLFPIADRLSLSPVVVNYLELLGQRFKKLLSKLPQVFPVDFNGLSKLYRVAEVFDPVADREGHLPFTSEFYAAMGTHIAREVAALFNPPFKVIGLDCDNTLWQGVCGEDGPLWVRVDGPWRFLQQFMIRCHDEGMLLALVSKNNEADVWEVFEKNPHIILKRDHLVDWEINWQSKSENLKRLAARLNLGLDSFIFIDDNPVECTEVMGHCPEVLTLLLPKNPGQIPLFLEHVWAFDRLLITGEDRRRTRMYQADKKRQEASQSSVSLDDFLRDLHLKIGFNIMRADQASRIAQLTQRTNQFNLSTIRRNESEIAALAAQPSTGCWVVEVSDRYGDYGLVGVAITEKRGGFLFLDTLLLSCRVLGRRVEDALLIGLKRYCRENDLSHIRAHYYRTEKNKPILEFLKRIFRSGEAMPDGGQVFTLSLEDIPDTAGPVDFCYLESLEGQEQTRVSLPPVPAMGPDPTVEASAIWDMDWELPAMDRQRLKHRDYYLPLEYHRADMLVKLPVEGRAALKKNRPGQTGRTARHELDEQLAALWRELLRLDQVDIDRSFFDLGGNSLKGVILLSRLHKTFNVLLTLKDLFNHPTIASLSDLVGATGKTGYISIPKAPAADDYALSPMQNRIYILQQLTPQSTVYNIPVVLSLQGNIEPQRLAGVFRSLIDRHETLRTSFAMKRGKPVQLVQERVAFELEVLGTGGRGGQSGRNGQELIETIIQAFIRPFDLEKAPLFRVGFIQLGPDQGVLMVDMHHIVADGTSLGIMVRDFTALYQGQEMPPLRLQYKDYAFFQVSESRQAEIQKQEDFWLAQFARPAPLLDLPLDFPRPVEQDFTGHSLAFSFTGSRGERLKALSRQHGATLYMVLLALFNVLLAKICGQEDIVVGTPVGGRRHADLEGMIGMFVNTLVLRNFPRADRSFVSFLNEVKRHTILAFENQEYPFEILVDKAVKTRDVSRNPLFDVMFDMQNQDIPPVFLPGLTIAPFSYRNPTSRFDLSLQVREQGENLDFLLIYGVKLFTETTIRRLIGYFDTLVSRVSATPTITLEEIDIIPEAERMLILERFNDTNLDFPGEKAIHELIGEQALKIPHRLALVGKGLNPGPGVVQMSYLALNELAAGVAGRLRDRGVGRGFIVGLQMGRSLEMVVGLLGILKAGCAYLPIDPGFPSERIEYMLQDSGAEIVIGPQTWGEGQIPSGAELTHQSPSLPAKTVLSFACGFTNCGLSAIRFSMHVPGIAAAPRSATAPLLPVGEGAGRGERQFAPTDPAYVIYTSGSTGRPKGVAISHRAVVNFIAGITHLIPFTENDAILSLTTLSFDIFGLETLLPLTTGTRVVVGDEEAQLDASVSARILELEQISHLQVTPSRLSLLLSSATSAESIKGLKYLMVGGEAFPPALLDKVKSMFGGRIYNMYGPTETTIWSLVKDLSGNESLTIGQPIGNTVVYVLDKFGRVQPLGVKGELYIGGEGLARGYLNNPELTAERFVGVGAGGNVAERGAAAIPGTGMLNRIAESPQFVKPQAKLSTVLAGSEGDWCVSPAPNVRLYKTGDLARWLDDGEIEFLGRVDFQVKIRGFRIELGEIESHLQAHEMVKEAVALVEGEAENKFLRAYLVSGAGVDVSVLREYLLKKVPDYMIPSEFILVEAIPLTPNGKVDRKMLSEMSGQRLRQGVTYVSPGTELEIKVAEAWKEVLRLDNVGIYDNFFALGGNSLRVIQLNQRLNEVLGKEIPLVAMFKYMTIGSFVSYLAFSSDESSRMEKRKEVLDRSRKLYQTTIHQFRSGGKNAKS